MGRCASAFQVRGMVQPTPAPESAVSHSAPTKSMTIILRSMLSLFHGAVWHHEFDAAQLALSGNLSGWLFFFLLIQQANQRRARGAGALYGEQLFQSDREVH